MSFEQKTWYNDGVAPEGTVAPYIDADNMNRIEKGISEAIDIAESAKTYAKTYADNNILHFCGTYTINTENNIYTTLKLPDDIDFDKYTALIGSDAFHYNLSPLQVLKYDTTIYFYHYGARESIHVRLNTTNRSIHFSAYGQDIDLQEDFDLFFIPTRKRELN